MNDRIEQQRRLENIAREVEPAALTDYSFDDGVFIVKALQRCDIHLLEDMVADLTDTQIADEIRLRWNL